MPQRDETDADQIWNLVSNSSEPVLELTDQARVRRANQAARELFDPLKLTDKPFPPGSPTVLLRAVRSIVQSLDPAHPFAEVITPNVEDRSDLNRPWLQWRIQSTKFNGEKINRLLLHAKPASEQQPDLIRDWIDTEASGSFLSLPGQESILITPTFRSWAVGETAPDDHLLPFQTILDWVDPEDRKRMEKVLQGELTSTDPVPITTPDGRRWLGLRPGTLNSFPDGPHQVRIDWADPSTEFTLQQQHPGDNIDFQAVSESVPGIVYRCSLDEDWSMHYISSGIRDLTGYEPSDVKAGDPTYNEIIHHEDRDYVQSTVRQGVNQKQPYDMRYRVKTRDGELRWVHETGRMVESPGGQPELVGVIVDVTREVQAKQDRNRLTDRLELATQAARLGIWEYEPAREQFTVDQRAGEIFGRTPDAQNTWDVFSGLVHPEDFPDVEATFQNALEDADNFHQQYRIMPEDSSEIRWVDVWADPVVGDDGHVDRVVGTVRDITSTRRMQNEQRRLADIVRETPEMISTATPDGKITYGNRALLETVELELSDLEGRDIADFHTEESIELLEDEALPTAREEGTWSGESELLLPDGSTLPVRQTIITHTDDEGEITEMSTIMNDISDLKEAQKQLLQQEKLAAIGEMAAGIMHEINNPNAYIKGNLEFLERSWDTLDELLDELGPEHEDKIQMIRKEYPRVYEAIADGTRRVESIVQDVKYFARKNTTFDEDVTVNLTTFLEECLETLLEIEDLTEDVLTLDVADHPTPVPGTETIHELIVENLVENAWEAMDNQPDPWIKVSVERREHSVQMTVEDNGEGMSEEVRSQVFDPFFTTRVVGEGTGLGLSIIHGLIEDLEGTIDVDSEPGDGTCFTLEFPLADQ